MSLDIKKVKNGAIWVSLLSVLGIPLSLYLNWILGFIDVEGNALGRYALIIIFINTVTTFTLFGGTSIITNFLPKIEEKENKGKFLFTFSLISLSLLIVFDLIFFCLPPVQKFFFTNALSKNETVYLLLISPLIIISQIIIFGNQGLMKYRKSAILNQLQVFVFSIIITIFYFYGVNYIKNGGIEIFIFIAILAFLIIILIGYKRNLFKVGFYWKKNFTNFSIFAFFNTLNTFLFANVDKLILSNNIGVKELGVYYVLLQISMLPKYLSIKIGQVLLSSFSSFIKEEKNFLLQELYLKTSTVIIFLSTLIAYFLILGSNCLPYIFGELYTQNSILILITLIFGVNLTNIGSINSMLILSKEKNKEFFLSNILLIVSQLTFVILLISKWGVWAVTIGKVIGFLVGQLGLFIILLKLNSVKIPKDYFLSQIIMFFSLVLTIVYQFEYIGLFIYLLLMSIVLIVFILKSQVKINILLNQIKIFMKK